MKKLILAGLATLALLPATAMAQPASHYQQERHQAQKDARKVHDARQDLREAKRDVRDARWDYAREVRDYNRAHPWRATFRYQRFQPGARIQPAYYGRAYIVSDYGRFRWAKPGVNQRWVRHYNDALLVNIKTGRVVKVVHNAFR
ncbi:hypothetical protein SLG_08230 [Sphingobium sp. SYK-6]|uniref:RcnB family protein n=1 Tax=Sphingobium sp. (strain NBRC 103272 / SYK-6) TaxID=627192 RepID=UPI0002276BDA|nr:RcnB family protein [Sphingobium sp. SYK-6]BAK65498.1 hypothetical protein SLG_08230 [Sphingobium sp. SYK-6]